MSRLIEELMDIALDYTKKGEKSKALIYFETIGVLATNEEVNLIKGKEAYEEISNIDSSCSGSSNQ